jgi:hypothetical protein
MLADVDSPKSATIEKAASAYAMTREDALRAVLMADLKEGKVIGASPKQQKKEYAALAKSPQRITNLSEEGAPTVLGIKKKAEAKAKMKTALAALIKKANNPTKYDMPTMDAPAEDAHLVDPKSGVGPEADALEEFLQAQQEMNEAEFYKQRAQEAEEEAAAANESAQMANDQLQQMQGQTAASTQASNQAADQAGVQAQMAQQDAVAARDESLQAQQQNIALRQAISSFRQQLMDMVAQDPTQAVAPPAAPTGPMMGGATGTQLEQAQAPQGVPPGGAPAEAAGPPPGGPPAMPPPAGMMPSPGGAPPPGGATPPPAVPGPTAQG